MISIQQVFGFFDKVGENTEYIIYPEEILADNFVLLLLGKHNVRSPEILSRMQRTLEKAGKAEQIVPEDAPNSASLSRTNEY